MKIIDLLNKIANGEEVPKKIIYFDKEFEYINGAYEDKKGNDLCKAHYSCNFFLNDEVEILEENKIPEKLDISDEISVVNCAYKINEIIDYLKSKGE